MKLILKILILSLLICSCKNESIQISQNTFTVPPQKMTNKIDSNYEFEFESIEANRLNSKAIEFAKYGKMNQANHILEKALKLEPKNPTIISNIANIEAHNSNTQRSIELSDSSYYPAIVGLSALCLTTKNYEKAIQLSEYVIMNDSKNPDLYVNLIIAQSAIGDCEKANSNFVKLKENIRDLTNDESIHNEHLINKCLPYLIACN